MVQGRKRRRKIDGPLTTINLTEETRDIIKERKPRYETYEDFLRRMLGI